MNNPARIREAIKDSIGVKEILAADPEIIRTIEMIAETCSRALCDGQKIMFCGNGGSAADAQHLAAELSGRFYFDRKPLAAEALTVNTSYLTAVSNDYSFEDVFSRLVEGSGRPGDILVGLSTSGNSENVVRAFAKAHESGIITVALTGEDGGKLAPLADYLICVPSADTPRIQESHILIGHIICELIENHLFRV
ncbi:MAG: D-sedoheptulose 7-phosphate isomerase [Bacteroidales bacterium]|jgi:D-sedoheptulose 7-phosphate isomerase|nr:D-sedoheptulose 7-phosphate isomerase [Bacteroidales bacterium]MDX9906922.1 D-sedoheptulose 7-phosphate isomerase [Bacteroidales bacterium]